MRTKVAQGSDMPPPRLNRLHILKQIASEPDMAQAELALRCLLSVAMVNNYMNERTLIVVRGRDPQGSCRAQGSP